MSVSPEQSVMDEDDTDDVPANDAELWEIVREHPEQDEEDIVEVERDVPDLPEMVDEPAEIPPIGDRQARTRREGEYIRRYREDRDQRLFDWGERQEVLREPVRRRVVWPELLPGRFAFRYVTLETFLVRYRNFGNEIVEFEGDRLGTTGVPEFPFEHLRQLVSSRICICFQLGSEFRHAKRWMMVQVDLNIDVSLVSQHMIRGDVVSNPVSPRQINLGYRGCEHVTVSQTAEITLFGTNSTRFELCVGLVSDFTNPTYDFNRLIIGRTAARRMMAGLNTPPPNRPHASGQLVLRDDTHPTRYFVTTYEERRKKT